MPGELTDYAEALFLKLLLRGLTQASAITPYIGLLTTPPTDAAGSGVEVPSSGYGYSRVAIGSTIFGADAANRQISNTALVTLPAATADYPAAVVSIACWDAASGGNMLWYCNDMEPHLVKQGDPQSIPIGAITIRANNSNLATSGANWLLNILTGRFYVAAGSAVAPVLALYKVLPLAADTGGTEVSATGYARKACGSAVFTADPTVGQIQNGAAVDFTTAAPWTTDAGDVIGAAIRASTKVASTDTATDKLMLFVTTPAKNYKAGDPCIFGIGSLFVSMN